MIRNLALFLYFSPDMYFAFTFHYMWWLYLILKNEFENITFENRKLILQFKKKNSVFCLTSITVVYICYLKLL